LDQDASAVAGVDLAAAGTAMFEVVENRERAFNRGVRFSAFDVDHEADTTGVVLRMGVVQASLWPALVRELRARARHGRASCRYNPLGRG